MKQFIIPGLCLLAFASCKNTVDSESITINLIKNDEGQVSEVKINRDESESNYIQLVLFPDGEIEYLREYKDGEENGKYFRWRENGRLWVEGYKVNGEWDRVIREVQQDGRTGFEGIREDLNFEGICNDYYPSGAVRRSWTRVNDKDLGRYVEYYENGMVKEVGNRTEDGKEILGKWDEEGGRQ